MFVRESCRKEIESIWNDFSYQLRHKNRFFLKHQLLELLDELCSKSESTIPEGSTLYRSRVLDGSGKIDDTGIFLIGMNRKEEMEKDFYGFNSDNSFVPPENNVGEGRNNPKGIPYLYTSEEIITSIMEVRPLLDDLISVCKIKVQKEKKIVNFAKDNYLADDEYFSVLSAFIAYKFSFPISNKEDYLETQFISEYVKLKGYQGIRYKSSLNRNGHNIVFFDYEDCKPVNSFPYKLDEITFKARCTFPMGKFDYKNDLIVTNKDKKNETL